MVERPSRHSLGEYIDRSRCSRIMNTRPPLRKKGLAEGYEKLFCQPLGML